MATPPTPTAGALTINATTGVILSPVTAALFKSANGIGSGSGDVTASGTLTSSRLIIGGGTTVVSASDLSYSTPTLTVPASFGITGAGSLAFTAGGSNQNITLTPSDSGSQGAVLSRAAYSGQSIIGTGGWQTFKEAVSGSIFPSIELVGYQNGQTAQMFNVIAKAGGTAAAPTTASANATIGGYRFYARANAGWRNVGNISAATNATFGDADFSTTLSFGPSTTTGQANLVTLIGGNASTGAGNGISLGNSASAVSTTYFTLDSNSISRSAAWGTTGVNLATIARTYTDTVSAGTVASAVGNSLGIPTFAASSATTFTQTDNLFIAGAVDSGTNVTQTNRSALGITGSYTNTSGFTSGISLRPTYNQASGTAANSDIFINRTETAVGSGAQRYLDFQTGGTSEFILDNNGVLRGLNGAAASPTYAFINDISIGLYRNANYVGITKALIVGESNYSRGAWGINGSISAHQGATVTDNASSGTVATAVANSFAAPTFAASSSTTFTNAANLYIAGDVAAGSNVTLTNSYGLWNVGKTRLDGPITLTPAALTYASPTSVNVNSATVFTVTTVNATGSVTFNASGTGRAGQPMTIIITNDATSAKTITFGSNFTANGTLTASGVNKKTTIQFISDGTSFIEASRTVLP